jgi:glycosyltransferase involved in cell wall biosynthesis
LPFILWKQKVDTLLLIGGSFVPFFNSTVVIQNMLVFLYKERNRFPFKFRIRYWLLEFQQLLSLLFSKRILFISNFSKNYILKKYFFLKRKESTVIYLGYNFIANSNVQIYKDETINVFYPSIINFYKHQINVIEAMNHLEGSNIHFHFCGPIHERLKDVFLKALVGKKNFHYHGILNSDEMDAMYRKSNIFLFASSCETCPTILIEMMQYGKPIVSSRLGPMPEFLNESTIFVDPLSLSDIKNKMDLAIKMYQNRNLTFNGNLGVINSWQVVGEKVHKFISGHG